MPGNFRIGARLWLGVGLLLLVVIAVIGVTHIDELESAITALLSDKNVKQKVVIDELDDVGPKK